MWWRRSTERVRTVSLLMFHLGAGDGLCCCGCCFCVCFVFCFVFVLFSASPVHRLLLHT